MKLIVLFSVFNILGQERGRIQIFSIEQINKFIHDSFHKWIEIRHNFHRHAELAWQEKKTTEMIRTYVENMGYKWNSFSSVETGGYVDYIVNSDASFIAWRADIDALPIPDDPSLEYCSLQSGISHACGHDFHMTVGLALAEALKKEVITPKHNIRIIFQPAEEPIPSGAFKLRNEKFIEELNAIFAIHVEPSLPVGTISFAEGWVNAQSTRLEIAFRGEGGHSARPHLTQDLIPVVSNFILESTRLIEELSTPEFPSVLAFTTIHGGDSYNSIPREIQLTGTLRVTKPDTLNEFLKYLNKKQGELKNLQKVEMTYSAISGAPPVIIKKDIYLSLMKIYDKFLKDTLSLAEYRSMGGDDFGWYLNKIPGAVIRIGVNQNQNHNAKSLHFPGFDATDESLSGAILLGCILLSMWD